METMSLSTREALKAAAIAHLEAQPQHALTMNALARAVGVSSGAPYRHFASLDALLREIARDGLALLEALTAEERARREDDPLEQFRAEGIASFRLAASHPVHFRLLHQPTLSPWTVDEEGEPLPVDECASEIPSEGDDEGILRLTGQAAIYGLARMLLEGRLGTVPHDDDAIRALAERVTDMLGTGFLPR